MDCGITFGLNKWVLASGLGFCSLAGYGISKVVTVPIATEGHSPIRPMAMDGVLLEKTVPVIEEVVEAPAPVQNIEVTDESIVETKEEPEEIIPTPESKQMEEEKAITPDEDETESYYSTLKRSVTGSWIGRVVKTVVNLVRPSSSN